MIHSLKVIGAILCAIVATTSAFTLSNSIGKCSTYSWGRLTFTSSRETQSYPLHQQKNSLTMMAAAVRDVVRPGGAGPAILERPLVEQQKSAQPAKGKKRVGSEGWELRIYNDGLNTREHVARCLVQIPGLSEVEAYDTMMQAHQNGIAVVGRWVYERAEMYRDALKKNGILCDMVPVDEDR